VPERGAKTVWITFSFSGGEVAEGLLAQAEAIKITLLAPDGARWNSDWQPITAVLNHDENGMIDASALQLRNLGTFIQLDRKFFDKFKDVPIDLQVEVASTLYRDRYGETFTSNQQEFTIPDVGICVVSRVSETLISCRSPLGNVPMVGVSVRLFRNCSTEGDSNAPAYQSFAWWLYSEQWSGWLGLNPVNQFNLSASHEVAGQALTTCPGSTFTIHQPEKIRRFRVQKQFKDVNLVDNVLQR
jgi:hypothetical protein